MRTYDPAPTRAIANDLRGELGLVADQLDRLTERATELRARRLRLQRTLRQLERLLAVRAPGPDEDAAP